MEIVVVGCGEAFDETIPNTSLLVRARGANLLLDCGYSVPQALWRMEPGASSLDLIYISHAHADHFFGLPALVARMWEEGRTKPLAILAQPEVLRKAEEALELGYPRLRERFEFALEFLPAAPALQVERFGCVFRFAATVHSTPNLAVRLEIGGHAVCYSGDGAVSAASRDLYRGADLLFHEAFDFEAAPVHATVGSVLAMAGEAGVRRLALMHVRRGLRRQRARLFEAMLAADVRCVLPNPGDVLFV